LFIFWSKRIKNVIITAYLVQTFLFAPYQLENVKIVEFRPAYIRPNGLKKQAHYK